MAQDYYQDANTLAETLRSEGLVEWSRALEDAMAAGSTATEILMALRWVTNELLSEGPSLSFIARKRAKALLVSLDGVLSE